MPKRIHWSWYLNHLQHYRQHQSKMTDRSYSGLKSEKKFNLAQRLNSTFLENFSKRVWSQSKARALQTEVNKFLKTLILAQLWAGGNCPTMHSYAFSWHFFSNFRLQPTMAIRRLRRHFENGVLATHELYDQLKVYYLSFVVIL